MAATLASLVLTNLGTSGPPRQTGGPRPRVVGSRVFEGWQHPASSVLLGAANPATILDVLFALVLQDANLQGLIQSVSDPNASSYRHYETVPWLASHTGATSPTVSVVLEYLRSQGIVGHLDPTASYVEAAISIRQAARIFDTSFRVYRVLGNGSTTVVAPETEPQLPRTLVGSVSLILGTTTVLSAAPVRPPPRTATPVTRSLLGSTFGTMGTPGGCSAGSHVAGESTKLFTPKQFLTAYGVETLHEEDISGQGQTVAILSGVPGRQSDLATFTHCYGLPTPQIENIPVGLGTRASLNFPAAHDEVSLDTEMVAAMAPRLRAIDVINTADEGTAVGLVELLDAPLNRALLHGQTPNVVSISFGFCEIGGSASYSQDPLAYTLDEHLLMDAAANGITVVNSSGDTGSSCNLAAPRDHSGARLSVQYPSSSPFVTDAGGSLLGLDVNDSIKNEEAWNDLPLGLGVASGGDRARCSPVRGINRPLELRGMVVLCPTWRSKLTCSIRSRRTARGAARRRVGNQVAGRARQLRFSPEGSPWQMSKRHLSTTPRSVSSTRCSISSVRSIRAPSLSSPRATTMYTASVVAKPGPVTARSLAGDR